MQFKETLIAAILIIAVLFALLIFGSKLPDPILDWQPILVIVCFVLLGLVVLFYIIQKILAIKSAMAIERKLKSQASEQISGAREDRKPELQAIQGQLSDALAALKTSKMGKGALYSMPWYMIIGPPDREKRPLFSNQDSTSLIPVGAVAESRGSGELVTVTGGLPIRGSCSIRLAGIRPNWKIGTNGSGSSACSRNVEMKNRLTGLSLRYQFPISSIPQMRRWKRTPKTSATVWMN